jgi:xanthine dehydrogenase YagT iron-sulfur-binding subunit
VLACLTLAATVDGADIVTIEGVGARAPDAVQEAFVRHDALQCGFCTPGQVLSAIALIEEARSGAASAVTADPGATGPVPLSDGEIRERMSGNLCRCGAYVNIVAAIRDAAGSG